MEDSISTPTLGISREGGCEFSIALFFVSFYRNGSSVFKQGGADSPY